MPIKRRLDLLLLDPSGQIVVRYGTKQVKFRRSMEMSLMTFIACRPASQSVEDAALAVWGGKVKAGVFQTMLGRLKKRIENAFPVFEGTEVASAKNGRVAWFGKLTTDFGRLVEFTKAAYESLEQGSRLPHSTHLGHYAVELVRSHEEALERLKAEEPWIKGEVEELLRQARALEQNLQPQPSTQPADLVSVSRDIFKHEHFPSWVSKSSREIWIQAIDCYNMLTDCREDLMKAMVDRRVTVRVMVFDPSSPDASFVEKAQGGMNDGAKSQDVHGLEFCQRSIEMLSSLGEELKQHEARNPFVGQLEVKTTSIPPLSRMYAFDPMELSGRMFVVPYVFGRYSPSLPGFIVQWNKAPFISDYYFNALRSLFDED